MEDSSDRKVYVHSQYELDAARFAHRDEPQTTIVIISRPDSWLGIYDPFAGSFEVWGDSRVEVFAPNRVSVSEDAQVVVDDTVTVFGTPGQGRVEREEWLPVTGYEGRYSVSSLGRVRRDPWFGSDGLVKPDKVLRQTHRGAGYAQVALYGGGTRTTLLVHRLVCEAFHGPAPEGKPFVVNRDGNLRNNRASNLTWGTSPRTHCKRGHKLTDENTYVSRTTGKRRCRECTLRRFNTYRDTKNAAAI